MTDLASVDLHVSRVMNAAHTPEERTKSAYTASQLYSKVGEFDKALSYIDMYLTAAPDHNYASAFYLRGTILEKMGRINDAISAYCNSLSLKPKQRDVTIKICEVVCSLERPSEDQLSKSLVLARKVAAPPHLLQSLEEKLALAKGDAQTLEKLYDEQVKRSPDDLLTYRKIVNLRLCLSDLAGAKKLVDQISARLPHATENLDWIQVCYAVYYSAYTSFLSVEGGSQQMEIYPLLSGMLGNLSSTFILKLSSDHKHPKETLRRFDSHLTALYSSLEKFPGNPVDRLPHQLRFKEYCAHFYQLCAYLLFKLAYDKVLDLSEMLQLAAVCLSISFSITPPSTRDEATEETLHMASSRMCEVGYLMAALTRLNGQEWLIQTVKPMISVEGISRIIEVLELQDTRQTPSCMRLPTIDISQVQCTSPSRNHLAGYHEAYLRDHLDQLPFLTWLSLAEVSAYGGHPSLPHSFSVSQHRFNSFPDGCEDLSRTDYSSCSRMDIETFLYMSLYETQQLESTAESVVTILLPIVLHKLSVTEARCAFWTSLIALDRAPQTNMSIKDACKYKLTVEKGLIAIRCLKKMELPTLIVYNIAEAFEQRLSDCSLYSPGYSEERQRLLVAMNKLYWTETLRRLEMIEAEVSSAMCDDSFPNCVAAKLLWVEEKNAVEGLSEERRKAMRSRAKMVQADLSLHSNQVLKALRIYENLDLPPAAWNHAQLLKLVALSGNPAIISRTQSRPSTAYDLLLRSQTILSKWTFREEVKQDSQMKQRFETEIQSLDKSILHHKHLESSPEHLRESNQGNVDNLNSGTFDQASPPPFSFPPQSASPHSTPKRNIPNGSDTLTSEEQQQNMEMQFERMSLALKQQDDIISDLSKENDELRGIIQNLQYNFTDQKALFKNPKDSKNAILRPEDIDNIPTPQAPSFNNSASLNKCHTPLNKSLLESSYQGYLTSDVLSPQIPNQGADFEYECEETQLMGTGSGQPAPSLVPFQLNLSASGSGPTEPTLSSMDKSLGSLAKANTSDHTEDFVCTAEHDALVNLPLVKTETGEESEEVLFLRHAKLYRFLNKKWKVRATGELKILRNPETGKNRIIMRRDVIKKLCCNHYITKDMRVLKKLKSDQTMNWYTPADFSGEIEQTEQFAARFKTAEFAAEFETIFNQCRLGIKASQSPRKAEPVLEPSPDTKTDFATDDVIIISVSQPGCRGCEDLEDSDGRIPENNTEVKVQPREEIPVKDGSIFGGNLAHSLTQTSSTNLFTRPGKFANEERGDTVKQNVPDPPVAVPLIKEATRGAERDEEVLFSRRAALHTIGCFDWKQRGEGDLKIFHNQQTGKYTVEMRREPGESICCRHFVTADIKLGFLDNDDISCAWDAAADSSGEPPQNERFKARFDTSDTANEFRETFEDCQLELRNRTLVQTCSTSPTTTTTTTTTTTDAADIVPDIKDDKTPDTSSKNEANSCRGAEHSSSVLFEEQTSLTVNEDKKIHDFRNIRIRIVGDSDKAKYRTILEKEGAVLFDIEVKEICEYKQYATNKNRKSWCWTVNKPEEQPKQSKFIVRFNTSAASHKFNTIMKHCILSPLSE